MRMEKDIANNHLLRTQFLALNRLRSHKVKSQIFPWCLLPFSECCITIPGTHSLFYHSYSAEMNPQSFQLKLTKGNDKMKAKSLPVDSSNTVQVVGNGGRRIKEKCWLLSHFHASISLRKDVRIKSENQQTLCNTHDSNVCAKDKVGQLYIETRICLWRSKPLKWEAQNKF